MSIRQIVKILILSALLVSIVSCGILDLGDIGTNIEVKNETSVSTVRIYLNGTLKGTINPGKSTKFGVSSGKTSNISAETQNEILAETSYVVIEGTLKLSLVVVDTIEDLFTGEIITIYGFRKR